MSEAPGLSGGLDLVCAAHPQRGTFIARQSFAAPMHLSKTYWDGGILLVNIVNQTAGWFGGDRVRVKRHAGTGRPGPALQPFGGALSSLAGP